MSAIELLSLLTRSSFLLLTAFTVVDWLRHRDPARLDIALAFVSLSVSIPIQWFSEWTGYRAAWLSGLVTVSLLAHPLLLLRLVEHFRPVPLVQQRVAAIGFSLSALSVLALPSPLPLVATLLVVGYFAYVEGYAALAFVRGALTLRGVSRQRLSLVSAATGLLAALILLAGLSALLPALAAFVGGPVQVLAIVAAIGYYLGFAPPRALRRAWQLSELYAYLRVLANQSPDQSAGARLEQLCVTATASVGGIAGAVALWADGQKHLTIQAASTPTVPLNSTLDAGEGAVERARRLRQPVLVQSPGELGAGEARLASLLGARALLAVPLSTVARDWGVLLVFAGRTPLFAADDLSLLALFTEQTALALDYGALLDAERSLSVQLAQRSAQLEAANKELEAFSYSVSHDLRAPLRHIGGYVELLQQSAESLEPVSRRYLGIVADATTRMGQLIDDLLAFSRVGRSALQRTRFAMQPLVQEVISDLDHDAQGRAVDWTIDELPCQYADRSMLRLVWVNLIANALKYTRPRARAEIEIGCNPNCTESVFFVRDNGVGFDSQYADKLFGVFQRLHSSAQFEGTGIGLANVRRIVSRHGGRAWAESVLDHGATFYFSLPNPPEE